MKRFLCALLLLILPSLSFAGPHAHPERWYQARWCAEHGGKAEVVLPDGTRCDCITSTHAVEFDFARKWAEAIGQALYYGIQTGKQPGIVLILESAKDRKFLIRLGSVVQHYGIPVTIWELDSFSVRW